MKIWFGKHKNEEVSDLPDSYLRWLAEGFDVTPKFYPRGSSNEERAFIIEQRRELIDEATEELEERGQQ